MGTQTRETVVAAASVHCSQNGWDAMPTTDVSKSRCSNESRSNQDSNPTSLSLPGREPANGHALLERHRRCLRERHPVLSTAVGHITDLETIVGRRVNRPTRLDN